MRKYPEENNQVVRGIEFFDPVIDRKVGLWVVEESEKGKSEADSPGDDSQIVRLKNGAKLDVRLSLANWETLKAFSDDHPALFAAAVAAARGELPISDESTHQLKGAFLVLPTGELRPSVRDILLSGLKQSPTGEGEILGSPFDFENESQREAVARCERLSQSKLLRVFGLSDHGQGPGLDK